MSKKILLVVEDDDHSRTLMREILQHYGYMTIEAVNGQEGVDKAIQYLPALIFMDIQMPVLDGLSAIKILKNNPRTKNIKIIAVSSYAMAGDREKVLAAGADVYLTKPINTRKLPEVVRKYLAEMKGETDD